MNREIHPTGKCFDDALDLMLAILKENMDSPPDVQTNLREHLYLVHGITTISGKPSAHAWLENDTNAQVYFVGILDGVRENFAAPRDQYYKELSVIETSRYLYREAFILNRQTGHYGPWKARYRALTRDASVCTHYNIDRVGPI